MTTTRIRASARPKSIRLRQLAVAFVLVAVAGLLNLFPAPAQADPGAAAVIANWSRQLPGRYMPVVLTATQGGGATAFMPGALYVESNLTRNPDGSLTTAQSRVLLSDRRTSSWPRQPFDVAQGDTSRFTLTLAGDLVEHNVTWGFTQIIPLSSIGNNMLAGWGGSIGNTGAPAYWVVAVSPRALPIPG
jgi:hypothetical protein